MTRDIVKANGALPLTVAGFTLAPAGLMMDGEPSFEDWQEAGTFLRHAEGAVHWWIGDWLNYGERAYGEKYAEAEATTLYANHTLRNDKWVAARIELSRRRDNIPWSHHAEVAAFDPEDQESLLAHAEREHVKRQQAGNKEGFTLRDMRDLVRHHRNAGPGRPTHTPDLPTRTYHCLVIDPPWDMGRSDRSARPSQPTELDYATLSVEQIANFRSPSSGRSVPDLADPDSCQLYLWTTQKYLPDALSIAKGWGFAYHCLLTWVKPTGMTPYSWMFNTEHVVFAYKGHFDVRTKGQKLSFEAPTPRGAHSTKPDVFYERVREASGGPRLDMFARKPHEGFEGWGNEL